MCISTHWPEMEWIPHFAALISRSREGGWGWEIYVDFTLLSLLAPEDGRRAETVRHRLCISPLSSLPACLLLFVSVSQPGCAF